MKLDVEVLRYLSKEDFRVLTAVEMGMRNHEIVPAELIDRIASLKHGGTYKVLKNLLKHKLVHHDSSKYDGFRLTYLGYDFLAIKTLVNRGVISSVGRKLGTGKESDIYEVAAEDGTVLAMKLHRLGRVSFRAVKSKRDYLRHRSSFNWLYLSRLAALKEFAFMKALEEHEFPVPNAVDCNRHCVIMSLVQGYPLVQVKELQNPEIIFETVLGVIVRLAEHGLIHCDFNEFNIMIDDDEKVTVIDFPQMVSVSHRNAQMYFDRDVECIFKFFQKRFNLSFQLSTDDNEGSDADTDETGWPSFSSISKSSGFLDKELAASGFSRKDQEDIEKFIEEDMDDTDSDREESEDKLFVESTEANVKGFSSLHLEEQEEQTSNNDEDGVEVKQRSCKAGQDNGPEIQDDSDKEEDNQSAIENDAELNKSLNKQRKRAVAAARGGRRSFASRNSYKDKGGKSSQNSRVQKQLCSCLHCKTRTVPGDYSAGGAAPQTSEHYSRSCRFMGDVVNSLVFGHGPCSGAKTTACLYYTFAALHFANISQTLVTVTQNERGHWFQRSTAQGMLCTAFSYPIARLSNQEFFLIVTSPTTSSTDAQNATSESCLQTVRRNAPQRHRYLGHHDHCLCRFWELESCLGFSKINEKTRGAFKLMATPLEVYLKG
uniref:Serine/threonine-protein kinase RIO2 n=1 Tax=Populus alba TaxID=43335 RepID=A0A4U5QAY9_POPAL|nr:hypothetical protein D5086_0000113260 [Populus alba]